MLLVPMEALISDNDSRIFSRCFAEKFREFLSGFFSLFFGIAVVGGIVWD